MDENRNPDPRDDKLTPGSLTESSGLLRWLDNFWYHYKWPVIIGTFFAVVLIIGLVQILSHPKYDVNLVNAYSYRMNNEERAAYEKLLNRFCPADYDGDGEKTVNLRVYEIISEEEYNAAKAAAESEAAANGETAQFTINTKYFTEEYNNFNSYVMTGDCSVYMVSPYLYDILLAGDRLRPLADVYGSDPLPAGATEDGCGVRLSQTDFYRYNPAAQPMPEDTILCLLRPTVVGESSNEAKYRRSVELFRALADFRVEE